MLAFDAMMSGNEWWGKVQAFRHAGHPDFERSWRLAKAGPNKAICLAWEALEARADVVNERTPWYHAACEEIAAARAEGFGADLL